MNLKSGKVMVAARISAQAHQQLSTMCEKILTKDKDARINLSKLLSFIIEEYYDRYFEKELEKISALYRDKRKEAKEVLGKITEDQLESVMKVLEKLKTKPLAPKNENNLDSKETILAS